MDLEMQRRISFKIRRLLVQSIRRQLTQTFKHFHEAVCVSQELWDACRKVDLRRHRSFMAAVMTQFCARSCCCCRGKRKRCVPGTLENQERVCLAPKVDAWQHMMQPRRSNSQQHVHTLLASPSGTNLDGWFARMTLGGGLRQANDDAMMLAA